MKKKIEGICLIMTIKEFIDKGGKIIAHWNFVDHCEDTFDKQFSNDYPTDVTLDGLVQQSNNEDSYTEYQEFDNDSELFDVISSSGEYLAKKVPENEATRIIN